MKYWKQGFYDEPQGGAIEITEEYYEELLNDQSNGFSIGEDSDGYPILIAPFIDYKQRKIDEITAYDKSEAVNKFLIQGLYVWLDKSTRSGLKLRFDAEKANGLTDTSLWYEGNKIQLNIDVAIGLLLQVELYASQCYDITQQHIANVYALTDIEEVKVYDYQTGYPEKLRF